MTWFISFLFLFWETWGIFRGNGPSDLNLIKNVIHVGKFLVDEQAWQGMSFSFALPTIVFLEDPGGSMHISSAFLFHLFRPHPISMFPHLTFVTHLWLLCKDPQHSHFMVFLVFISNQYSEGSRQCFPAHMGWLFSISDDLVPEKTKTGLSVEKRDVEKEKMYLLNICFLCV